MLNGGMRRGELIELIGQPASGKTHVRTLPSATRSATRLVLVAVPQTACAWTRSQLCCSASAAAAVRGRVVYIETRGADVLLRMRTLGLLHTDAPKARRRLAHRMRARAESSAARLSLRRALRPGGGAAAEHRSEPLATRKHTSTGQYNRSLCPHIPRRPRMDTRFAFMHVRDCEHRRRAPRRAGAARGPVRTPGTAGCRQLERPLRIAARG